MAPRPSRSEASMDEQLAALPPQSPRHRALSAARAFKGSWVRLGEALLAVRQSQAYTGWGFASFADYCRHELHIRRETANKLTRSYAYLAEHAPDEARAQAEKTAPPALDVVDLLRQARGRTQIHDHQFSALQNEALGQGGEGLSRAQLLARLQQSDPAAYPEKKGAVAPGDGEAAQDLAPAPSATEQGDLAVDPLHARKVLLLAERLYALLGEQPALAAAPQRDALAELVRVLRHRAVPHKAASAASAARIEGASLH